jgi:hypothetical protein
VSQRAERELLSRVDEAARLLKGAQGAAPALKRAIESAERAARRIRGSDAGAAVIDALEVLLRDLGAALDAAWDRWLQSADATTLWRTARSRALVLQDDANLDGSAEHAGLDGARALLRLLTQWDALVALGTTIDATSALGARCQRARTRLLEDASARVTVELQAACRLAATGSEAAQGHSGDGFPPALLPALAEAASAASKVPTPPPNSDANAY